MKRLLCIVSSMDRGGAETFLMKLYRCINREEYQFDFCVNKDHGFYNNEIKEMGGKIFVIPAKSRNPIKCFKSIKNIVKNNKYEYVLRTSQESLATLDLIAAKCGGAKRLIYRSSNAGLTGGFISKTINKLFFFLPRIIPNVKIAPSTEAAEYVFGKNSVKKGRVTIINNGLDYEIFKFDKSKREKIRKQLNIKEDTILYGHVGRFDLQKNHTFLIDVYNEISKNKDNNRLLMIGNGNEKDNIKKKVKKLGIDNKVIFLDTQENIQDYFMAMDLLIFPSLFEGMPNVIIEAQATGLKCVVSDNITKEANITGSVKYISLRKSCVEWYEEIIKCDIHHNSYTYDSFKSNGYLIGDILNKFISNVFK